MRRYSLGLIAVLVLVAVGVFWTSLRQRDDVTEAGRFRIRFQLQWFDQAQFAGFYAAAENGDYKKQGLDVTIVPGGYTTNPIQQVVTKQAEVALATGDQVLLAKAAGHDLKVIGTVFNRSVACFMSKSTSGIRTPQDLVGRKVGVYRGFDTENVLLSILSKQRISPAQVQIVDAGVLEAFLKDEIEVFPSYVFNEPLRMQSEKIPVTLMRPEEFGVEFYSDTIFTTREYWEDNKDILTKFLRASAQGWMFAEQSPQEAIGLMYKSASNLSKDPAARDHQLGMLNASLKYLRAGNHNDLFYMERSKWESMEASLVAIGKLKTPGHVGRLCDFEMVSEALK